LSIVKVYVQKGPKNSLIRTINLPHSLFFKNITRYILCYDKHSLTKTAAPAARRTLGMFPQGTVRLSLGHTTGYFLPTGSQVYRSKRDISHKCWKVNHYCLLKQSRFSML